MDDATLRRLGRAGGASEARLIRLRGQARLIIGVGLEPADAALLLHAGVPDPRALAQADPQRLLVQMGRLQRRLTGMAAPLITLATLQSWIRRARAQGHAGP
ncbi:conserved protein of unknown function [Cyanobium sp. NIES-981]|nr:conserved protein of unknown function [Cyanobium sp. NIES-981]